MYSILPEVCYALFDLRKVAQIDKILAACPFYLELAKIK